jgi:hypothetical protein
LLQGIRMLQSVLMPCEQHLATSMHQADILRTTILLLHVTDLASAPLPCIPHLVTCHLLLLRSSHILSSMTKKHGRDSQPAADQAPTASPSTKKQRLADSEDAAPTAAAAAVTADTTLDDLISVACGDARGRYSSSKDLILVDSSEQQGSWVSRADFVNKLGGRGSHDYLKAIKVVAEDGSSLGQLGKYLKGRSVTPARPQKQQQGKQEQSGEQQNGDEYEFPPDGEAETAAAEGEAGTANGKAKGGAKAAAGPQGGSGSSRRRSSAAAAPASAEPKSGRRSSKAAVAAPAAVEAEEEQAAPAAAGGSGGSSGAAAPKRGRRSSAAKAPESEPAAAATVAAAGSGGKGRAPAAKGRRSKAAAAAVDADTAPAAAAAEEEGVGDAAADSMAGHAEGAAAAAPSADVEPDTETAAAGDQPAADAAAAAGSGPSKAQQKKHGRARRQKLSSAATWDGLEGGTSTAAAAEAAAAAAAGGEEGPVDGELDANMQGVFPAVQQPEDESLVSLMNGPDVGAGPVGDDAVGQGGDGHDQFGAGLQYDWVPGAEEAGAAAAGAEGEQQQEDGVEGEAAAAAAGEEGVEGAAGVGEGEGEATAAAEEQAAEQGDAAAAAAAMEVDAPAEPTAPAAAETAAVAAGGGSITFAELCVQLLQPAAQASLDQLWGVAQQYGPSASAAFVRVAPILQIYGDEAILGDSRVCFVAGEEGHRQQAVQRLTALQQLLAEPAMGGEGVLQQGQHEALCVGVDSLLADFATVEAAAGSG